MKKKIIIIIGILVAVLLAIVCFIVFGIKGGSDKNLDILSVSNKEELQEYVSNNKIESYGFDEDVAYIRDIKIFDKTADIEFLMTDDVVDEIDVYFTLFQIGMDEEYENDTDVSDDTVEYQFTDKDKEQINKSFEIIKTSFGDYLGCSFEKYDVIPIENSESLENNEENFYAGKFLKEYSVRDKDGVLWIMRFEASYGSATTVIYKLVDESGFDNFIPSIDLTK